ncbi:C40 family peptidase [Saccharibacillus kuerlensis]|uniref:C40 family peptidase n=1 Tax=Saccharibacillus kuerlensis TaxID=459527 RepID=UPI00035D5DAF|nr:C40 family peptidase [Saccharibacillus kuerlensis]
MKRNLYSLFAASALLVTVPVVAEASSSSSGKVDRPVNLRSAPSASEGSVYRTLQPGTKLEAVTELNAYWLKVQVGGKTGYVASSYVTYDKKSASVSGKTAAAASKPSAAPSKAKPATASSKEVTAKPSASPSKASTAKPAAAPSKAATTKPSAAPSTAATAKPAPAAAPSTVKTSTDTVIPASVSPISGSGVVTKNVNFRAEPTTSSAVHRVLSAGESFAAVELANSAWLKITDTNGVTGYVSTSYVTYSLPGGETSTPSASSTPAFTPPAVSVPAVPVSQPQPAPQPLQPAPQPLQPAPQPAAPVFSSDMPIDSVITPGAADRVIDNALALQGITRYGFGKNEAPVLFDCSSFTRYVFGLEGVSLPFGTAFQKDAGIPVERGQWQKGDLLFFSGSVPGLISHVGIYDGNGNLVHNSASKNGVVVSSLDLKYWQDHYVSARRVLQ